MYYKICEVYDCNIFPEHRYTKISIQEIHIRFTTEEIIECPKTLLMAFMAIEFMANELKEINKTKNFYY